MIKAHICPKCLFYENKPHSRHISAEILLVVHHPEKIAGSGVQPISSSLVQDSRDLILVPGLKLMLSDRSVGWIAWRFTRLP